MVVLNAENLKFKGTENEISSDLSFIFVRFTTITFKPLLYQGIRRFSYLYSGKFSVVSIETARVYTTQCAVYPEAEFKEFESRLKYGWFHLKLYSIFQDLSQCSIETDSWGI